MENRQSKEVIYPITIKDLQIEALNLINRRLTDDELYTAKKCIEWGLSSVIDITMKAAIKEAVLRSR